MLGVRGEVQGSPVPAAFFSNDRTGKVSGDWTIRTKVLVLFSRGLCDRLQGVRAFGTERRRNRRGAALEGAKVSTFLTRKRAWNV